MNARRVNLLDYLEDEDKYIQINNMSIIEKENFHVERRSKDKVVNNYGKDQTGNTLRQFLCTYSEWA